MWASFTPTRGLGGRAHDGVYAAREAGVSVLIRTEHLPDPITDASGIHLVVVGEGPLKRELRAEAEGVTLVRCRTAAVQVDEVVAVM